MKMRRSDRRGSVQKIAIIALVVMALGVAGVVVMLARSRTDSARLYFDNGTDAAVKIEVDGKTEATVPAHAAAEVKAKVGSLKLRVLKDNGSALEEATLDVPAAQGITDRKWIYNVAGKSRYKVYSLAYGNATPDRPRPIGEGKKFFELPSADAYFLGTEAPADKGRAGTTVAVVGHEKPHPAWPCCKNLRDLSK